jgi:surface-adhesin protein E
MDGKGNTVYFDPETVSRSANFVKVWVLLDAITARETLEGSSFLSSRVLHQYDCGKKRFRFLAFALFSGKMGTGQLVATEHYPFEWERVPPKGSAHRLLELVCSTSQPNERFAGP